MKKSVKTLMKEIKKDLYEEICKDTDERNQR